MSHRRLASLAVAASLVLVLGLFVRNQLKGANQPAPSAPPSEASALQQLSNEGLLRRASSFVSERASNVARYVVYVPLSASSGVRWGADTVVSAGRDRALDISIMPATDSGTPTVRDIGNTLRNEWLLVVGRTPSGRVVSLAGAAGGQARTRCASREFDEVLLSVPLQDPLAGAGVFDINGALVGMVLRCGQRLAAIPVRQISTLLDQHATTAGTAEALGASLVGLDSVARAYFGTDTGVLITAVRSGSAAQEVGLRAGDILYSIDDAPVMVPSEVSGAIAARRDTAHRLIRLRGRARALVRVPATDTSGSTLAGLARGLGLEFTSDLRTRGVAVAGIQPGSVIHAAGLRSGDRLTRIGSTDVASPSDAERLLRTSPPGPIFIAFDRDSTEYGVLVRR